jgi:1-pyrroline-2-carboxylate reductase [NAD(P)H]
MAYAYAAIRPLKKVLVWGRDKRKALKTIDTILSSNEYQSLPLENQFDVEVVDDVNSALANIDIITCVTGSDTALFDGTQLLPGTHVDLIGNHDNDKRECDTSTVVRSSVFVDSKINVLAEAGDLLIPIEHGLFAEQQIQAELTDLCSQSHLGRQSLQEITLYKSVGSALADLAAVKFVLTQKEIL